MQQVTAPGDADAGMGIENHRFILRARPVVEQEGFSDFRTGTEVKNESGCDAPACPVPVRAAEICDSAVVPFRQVAAPFEGYAVFRGMNHQKAVAVRDDADVFSRIG